MNQSKPKVVGVKLVGSAYHGGTYCPGWGIARLSDGRKLFVREKDAVGLSGVLASVSDRADVTEYNERLDAWVKTGVMPPAK